MFAPEPVRRAGVLWVGILLALLCGACGEVIPQVTPAETASVELTPYWTPTPSRTPVTGSTPQPAAGRTQPPTIPPPPTPTPFTYSIQQGDTMLGIAFQHGISLEELQAANPDVDPNFLSVGTQLVIPIGKETPSAIPSPTPVPVSLETPDCYAAPDGVWCFVPVENDQSQALENVSAWVRLYNEQGEVVAGQEAILPLNLLEPERSLPLVVFFDQPESPELQETFVPEAELLTAFTVPEEDARYLQAQAMVARNTIDANGLQATVEGWVEAPSGSPEAEMVWLAVVAYGAEGEVVGVRKIELEDALSPGEILPFEATVYSLGPAIQRVEVLVEARAMPDLNLTLTPSPEP